MYLSARRFFFHVKTKSSDEDSNMDMSSVRAGQASWSEKRPVKCSWKRLAGDTDTQDLEEIQTH